jgi:2-hydroxychromene-2-carboxylate isomerase
MSDRPILYFDLASPYAYLAVARAERVLGVEPELEPILLGAIFQWRGRGSWAATEARAAGMAEVEARARRYGLPPVVWPPGWPLNSLQLMRAATWAKQHGAVARLATAVYRREFAEGADVTRPEMMAAAAAEAALDPEAMLAAVNRAEIKDALRAATERAWKAGVRGAPSLRIGATVIFGDDRLEEAASPGLRRPGA